VLKRARRVGDRDHEHNDGLVLTGIEGMVSDIQPSGCARTRALRLPGSLESFDSWR
jgi:hypothetical protein